VRGEFSERLGNLGASEIEAAFERPVAQCVSAKKIKGPILLIEATYRN